MCSHFMRQRWLRRRIARSQCHPFLSIPLLPSTDSATGRPVLFVGFHGTTSESDFSTPYIIGFGGCLPDAAHEGTSFRGGGRDLPVPAQRACERARVSD